MLSSSSSSSVVLKGPGPGHCKRKLQVRSPPGAAPPPALGSAQQWEKSVPALRPQDVDTEPPLPSPLVHEKQCGPHLASSRFLSSLGCPSPGLEGADTHVSASVF